MTEWRSVSKLIGVLVAGLLITSGIGFFPAYLSEFPEFGSSGWQVHFHVLTVLGWLAMLATQGLLAAKGRIELHRRVGRVSFVLVPLIILGFVLVSRFGQARHAAPALVGAAIFDGGLFTLFYALAIVNRRDAGLHSRYMLLTGVAFINAPLGRAIGPAVSVPLELLVILALLIVATRRGQPARPFAVGAVAYVLLLAAVLIASPPP